MGWGQLLGAAAGYYFGGPSGAAAGAALGGGLEEATGGGTTGAIQGAADKSVAASIQASEIQKQIADQQIALQREQFNKQIELQQPFQQAGTNALARMQGGAFAQPAAFTYGAKDYQADPGYAFRLSEGQKALDRQAAARGGLISGGALRAATRYGQDMGSQEFGNAYQRAIDAYNARVAQSNTGYNRLASMAGIGQTATGNIGTAGQNMTSGISGALGSYGTGASNAAMNQGDTYGNAMLAAERARQSAYGNIGTQARSGGFNSLVSGFYGPGQYNQRMGVNFTDPNTYG
jgi:hypothetical protein